MIFLIFSIVIISAFIGSFTTSKVYENKPSAMDVYQGKTTLEYKVVDGVKVDSCVIFKTE